MKRVAFFLLTVLSVILGIAVATPSHASSTIVFDSLTFSPDSPVAGSPVTATLKMHTTAGCLILQVVSIGVRSASGANLDFPHPATNAKVCTGTYTHTDTQTLAAAGTYSSFGYYELSNAYHNGLNQNLVVTSGDGGGGSIAAPSWNSTGTYTNTFDDEFNATGLDNIKWETGFNCGLGGSCVQPGANPLENDCYSSANVTQPGDGYVHMALTNTSSSCGGVTKPYTGSYLDNKLVWSQTGGSWEARMYIPSANGQVAVAAWPAFWPTNAGTADEVDVMEGLPEGTQTGATAAHTHYTADTGGFTSQGPCFPSAPAVGWHNFGVALNTTSDVATFYYDGAQLCQLPMDDDSALHLTFDNAIQNSSVVPSTWPDTMMIDWVRVWAQ